MMKEPKNELPLPSHLHRIVACENQLEEAIQFLVLTLAGRVKKGKKPVILHSLRVAWHLLDLGCDMEVVTAGLLHDVLEKTSLTGAQIARRFGVQVGHMVSATTNDPGITDSLERYRDSVRRCADYGEGALLVRAADLIDNCDRLLALDSRVRLTRVGEKLRMLIEVCREEWVDERMIEEMQRRLRRVCRKVSGLALVAKKHPSPAKAARLSSRHK